MAQSRLDKATEHLIPRDKYLAELFMFKDTELIKVVTGIRRCGKSSLLSLAARELSRSGVPPQALVSANLENKDLGIKDEESLYDLCKSNLSDKRKTYFFIDEIQIIDGWHRAINSLRSSYDCDIYITGSNAFLMSSELATYLSGRYVEINMFPLTFAEYVEFCKLQFTDDTQILQYDSKPVLTDTALSSYMKYGGLPAIAEWNIPQHKHEIYMQSLVETVVKRDILQRGRGGKLHPVKDEDLLEKICLYISDSIGNLSSPNRIANTLTASGRQTSNKTVQSYLDSLTGAFITYPCKRYDIHGHALLKTNPKYYLVDMGIRSYLDNYRNSDSGRVLENIVYLQLRYLGYSVNVGSLYKKEIDFVASRNSEILYIQVTDEMYSEATQKRELTPLLAIKDNHPKLIVVRQGSFPHDIDGVRIISAAEFLLTWGVG